MKTNILIKYLTSRATTSSVYPSMHILNRKEMTDEQLVEAILRQQAPAQRLLYDKYARKMFGVCLRYAKGKEEAEDLLQEGFIKVFQKLSSYKAEGSLEGWIRRIIINTSLDYIRRQKINWTDIEHIHEPGSEPEIMQKMGTLELLSLVQKLPTGFRTIFNLYAVEGFSHREIGVMLNISEGTSKSQYSRARSQLLQMLCEINKENSIHANE